MTSHRDATTGQYVTAEHAKTNPDTTVSESRDHQAEPIVRTVGDRTPRHVGRGVSVDGFVGELVALVALFDGIVTVEVLTVDDFSAPRRCTLDTPCEVLP